MSMNKRELAEHANALRQVVINRALRWSDNLDVSPDIPIPEFQKFSAGWTFNPFGDGKVFRSWSSAVSHGDGEPPPLPLKGYYAGTQGGICLYSTKTLALRAMRCEIEKRCARILADIDAQIALAEGAA